MYMLVRPLKAVLEALFLVGGCIFLGTLFGALVGTWGFWEGWFTAFSLVFMPDSADDLGGRIVFLILVSVIYYVGPPYSDG